MTITSYSQKKVKKEGAYNAYLYAVEVPKNVSLGKIDSLKSIYEDSLIKINWSYDITQLGFELLNKTEQTLKLIWDEAAFISLTNETLRTFHKGVKYIDRENTQPPTSIYKKTTLSDLISPTTYTRYTSGQYGGWVSDPLIPVKYSLLSSKIEYIEGLLGLTMRAILPIKIEDKTFEYAFSFRTEFIEKVKKQDDFEY